MVKPGDEIYLKRQQINQELLNDLTFSKVNPPYTVTKRSDDLLWIEGSNKSISKKDIITKDDMTRNKMIDRVMNVLDNLNVKTKVKIVRGSFNQFDLTETYVAIFTEWVPNEYDLSKISYPLKHIGIDMIITETKDDYYNFMLNKIGYKMEGGFIRGHYREE